MVMRRPLYEGESAYIDQHCEEVDITKQEDLLKMGTAYYRIQPVANRKELSPALRNLGGIYRFVEARAALLGDPYENHLLDSMVYTRIKGYNYRNQLMA